MLLQALTQAPVSPSISEPFASASNANSWLGLDRASSLQLRRRSADPVDWAEPAGQTLRQDQPTRNGRTPHEDRLRIAARRPGRAEVGAQRQRGPHRRLGQRRHRHPQWSRDIVLRRSTRPSGRPSASTASRPSPTKSTSSCPAAASAPTRTSPRRPSTPSSNFSVPADKIKVTVSKGWVKLEGEVEWQYQRDAAEAPSATCPA